MKYFLIAGEASGDLHASRLMKEILAQDPEARFRFLGGDGMAAVGGEPLVHYRELAFMGLGPVLAHLPQLLKHIRRCRAEILAWKPDALILVDYASFNLRVAAYVKRRCPDIPIHFYISPKLWAWNGSRIRQFRRFVDKLYLILPFEKEWFARRAYSADYVGNPSVDSVCGFLPHKPERAAWCTAHGLHPDKPVLALLPGSRRQEVERNLPVMLAAARRHSDTHQVVVAGGPGLDASVYASESFPVVFGETYELLSLAHTALVVSGTATLETALFGVPQTVCYQMPANRWMTDLIFKGLLHVRFISLVNLVAGRPVVDELVGGYLTPDSLDASLSRILEGEARERMLRDYTEIRQTMGEPGTDRRTARLIVSSLLPKTQQPLQA